MADPIVSVLLTAYNREQYLAASIESVLAQSFGDFELIVVDDRSVDGTVEIARSYERLDSRVRVIVNDHNYGQFPNRNRAATFSTAPFLKYHDSDDVMYPHCLAVMVPPMQAEPRAGFGLSTGRNWPGGPVPMLLSPRESYQREFLGFGLFMCGPAGAIFRTQAFRDLGGFEDHGTPSDTIFWIRACARHQVLLLPGDLFYYREHDGQAFRETGIARRYAVVTAHLWRALSASDCPLDPAERRLARRNVAFSAAKSAWNALRQGDPGLAWCRISESGISGGEWLRYLRPPRRSMNAGTPDS
jgi:glycosyltransferase involved in cell wall biosynthesis